MFNLSLTQNLLFEIALCFQCLLNEMVTGPYTLGWRSTVTIILVSQFHFCYCNPQVPLKSYQLHSLCHVKHVVYHAQIYDKKTFFFKFSQRSNIHTVIFHLFPIKHALDLGEGNIFQVFICFFKVLPRVHQFNQVQGRQRRCNVFL